MITAAANSNPPSRSAADCFQGNSREKSAKKLRILGMPELQIASQIKVDYLQGNLKLHPMVLRTVRLERLDKKVSGGPEVAVHLKSALGK